MPLQAAIGSFFVEFSAFEMQAVSAALQALSNDRDLVRSAEQLLELDARLTLLERLAFARGIAPPLLGELEEILGRARALEVQREELAASLTASAVSVPVIAHVEEFANEAIALRGALQAVTARFETPAAAEPG